MTKQELQAQIDLLVSELEELEHAYAELSYEAMTHRMCKNKFYEWWRKADVRADRYEGVLLDIKDILDRQRIDNYEQIYDLNEIGLLIDKWYEKEDQ